MAEVTAGVPALQTGERLHLVTNKGIFDLTDASPDYLTQVMQGAFLQTNHKFVSLHNRTKVITDSARQTMYMRAGVARAVVEDPAKFTWMRGFTTTDETDAKLFAKIQRVLVPAIQTADIWNRLYGMGLVVLGFNDGRALSAKVGKATDIAWAHGFSKRHIRRVIYDRDHGSPTYGQPRIYILVSGKPGEEGGGVEIPVHADRVLPIRERPHIHPIQGGSVLDPCWNDLEDLCSIGWANSEAYYSNASPKIIIKTQRPLSADDEKKLDSQLTEIQSSLRHVMKTLQTVNVETLTKGSDIVPPLEHLITAFSFLASSTGMPFSWFFRHHITSGEGLDWANREWHEYISARQQSFGNFIIRDLLDRLIAAGMLEEEDRMLPIEWHPPRVETREDIGKLARNEATAWATAAKTGKVHKDLLKHFVDVPPGTIVEATGTSPTSQPADGAAQSESKTAASTKGQPR